MKLIFTLPLLLFSLTVFSQQRSVDTKASPATSGTQASPAAQSNGPAVRSASSSSQARTSEVMPLPYDVNDKYMGRRNEFLNSMIVDELPADFPVYDKQWSLKDYNLVVDAYFINHKELLKERVKEKVTYLQH